MKFELSYSILYSALFKTILMTKPIDITGDIEQLNFDSAQLLQARLDDPFLVERMSAALLVLGLDCKLDFNQAFVLLIVELTHRQSLTNYFIWQEQINYSDSNGLHQRDLQPEEQTAAYFTEQVLAHGLRWGWQITELMGKSAIVVAETEVVVDYQGCSCKQKSCAHQAFVAAVRTQWDKMPYCIKLVNSTLT
jgi:hypothetical protein